MKKIAFFDSGVGGLNVLKEALRILPHESYFYYADVDHAPYGTKSTQAVKQYVLSAVKFIINLDIKALVIACNTATSVAINDLRQRYTFPIIGMEPAVKPALAKCVSDEDKILVLATPLTLQETKLADLITTISTKDRIDLLPFPELTKFAENFELNSERVKTCIKEKLQNYNLNNYQALVLGCTHYLFFKDLFAQILPKKIVIMDGAEGTVLRLKSLLTEIANIGEPEVAFYFAGREVTDPERLQVLQEIVTL